MKSFVNYVLRFKREDTPLGDVARDMSCDPNIKKSWGYTQLMVYLIGMNATDRIYGILEEAKISYTVLKLR
jgi:hypothetical protein